MPVDSSPSMQRRFRISEIEYKIRRMEVELDFHHEQGRLIEETIREEQQHFDRLQSRPRHSRIVEEESNNEFFSNAMSVGIISILQSMKEMIEDGDDIRTIDFEYLIEKEIRNISDPKIANSVCKARQERKSIGILEGKFK